MNFSFAQILSTLQSNYAQAQEQALKVSVPRFTIYLEPFRDYLYERALNGDACVSYTEDSFDLFFFLDGGRQEFWRYLSKEQARAEINAFQSYWNEYTPEGPAIDLGRDGRTYSVCWTK